MKITSRYISLVILNTSASILKIRGGDKMEKMEILKLHLGAEELLNELLQALSNQELEEDVEFIARNWNIKL